MKFADLDLNKLYTYADYYKWQFDERVELIEGKIFQMNTPNPYHQELAGEIFTLLKNFLRKNPCKVYIAPFDVRITRKSTEDKDITTVLQPDICVICDLSKVDRRGCIGAPDLVIEILSPGNNAKELKNKYEAYEEAGVKEYWVVSPQNQTFLVYTLLDNKFQLSPVKVPGDTISSSALPGFTLNLTELFKDMDPEQA
jgi:Uma2 family endonuclease